MKVYNLPFDIINANQENDNPVIIRSYNTNNQTINNKIVLHRNMINLLISGTKTIVYPSDVITISDKEFLILSSGNVLTSEILKEQHAFESILIYFSNDVLADFLIKYNKLLPENVKIKTPFLTYLKDDFIINYINSLTILLSDVSGISPELGLLKLEELLIYLNNKDPAKLHSLFSVTNDNDELKLKQVVECNIAIPMKLEELSFLCNVSTSTFKRRFHKLYGESPQKWLLTRRMNIAADLLKHPDERSGLVYLKVGYENQSSFSYAFKQQFGVTPSEYQHQKRIHL